MKIKSLKSKLVISVFAFVIGSGLIISLMETHRFSKKMHEDAIIQGEYLAKAIALEDTRCCPSSRKLAIVSQW